MLKLVQFLVGRLIDVRLHWGGVIGDLGWDFNCFKSFQVLRSRERCLGGWRNEGQIGGHRKNESNTR